jgi:uncharacterized membrane protein
MNFGISTNTALVVASAAVIESLLESQKSQINAAKEVADVQGKAAQGQANATLEAGQAQAEATRAQSYVALTQACAATVGAAYSSSNLREAGTILNERDTSLGKIKVDELDPASKPLTATASTASNPATITTQEKASRLSKAKTALEDKSLDEAKTEIESLKECNLTAQEYASLRESVEKRKSMIVNDFHHQKSVLDQKGQYGSNVANSLNGLSAIASASQAAQEIAKAEQDALTQVDGAINQQTQSAYQQLLDARQNLAQEITRVLDAETQALQAVNLRG